MNKKYFDSRKGSVEATINTIRSEQKTIVKEEPKVSLQPKSYFGQKKDSLADVAAKVVSVNENIEVYITKKGSGPVNKRSIVKDFNNKAEAEKWIKWYKTGNMKDVESIYLSIQEDVESIKLNEDYKSDYEKEQPIKVKKAIEIAKRMAGNHTGATKEIEKLAKGLSQLPVVKSVLMRVNESNDMGYVVKFAKKKDGKIETAWYRSKEDAEKALASLKKDGLNGIISKGRMDEEARDLKFGNITVITITKDGKRKEIEKKDLQRWKDDGWKLAEEAPANATGTAVAGTGDDSSTVVVRKKKKKELQSKLMRRLKIKETIDRAIPDLEYPKDEIRERVNQLKGLALGETSKGFVLVSKAKEIAKKMSGDMKGAIKEIEKLKKGLSGVYEVELALKAANEDKDLVKEYSMGLQVPSTSYMKPVGDLNKGKPLRKREMTMDIIPQGELKPLKKKNEISNRLKSKVLKRK